MYTKANSIKRAEQDDIIYNMIRAKTQHFDHKLRYASECKEASSANPTYTELKLRIKKKWLDRARIIKEKLDRKYQ